MRPTRILTLCLLLLPTIAIVARATAADLDVATAERFAQLAMECVHR